MLTFLEFALKIASYFLGKNAEDTEMQELFYKWVEKHHGEYLNSAKMRDAAKARWQALEAKPFVQTK